MSTELETLGSILSGGEQRDAVHVAISPVVAAEKLAPGQDVGFVEEGNTELVGVSESNVGIIDPFLSSLVFPEQRCWLWLYPRTITSLRHDWSHPEFEKQSLTEEGSRKWMEEFASGHVYYPNYYSEGEKPVKFSADQIIQHATDFLDTGERFVQRGSESLRDSFWDDGFPDEFWKHYEVLTGRTCTDRDDRNPFCCTC